VDTGGRNVCELRDRVCIDPDDAFYSAEPFTALFLRLIETKRTPLHRENGLVQVYLADLDSTLHPQKMHDHVWELTKRYRANRVEPQFAAAARARVTFSAKPSFRFGNSLEIGFFLLTLPEFEVSGLAHLSPRLALSF
jgi:hypothetical protein